MARKVEMVEVPLKKVMKTITLDKTRSCNTEKSVYLDGLTYYQINDSDELCVCVNKPEDTANIQGKIPVTDTTPSRRNSHTYTSIPIGEYRVTAILLMDSKYECVVNIPDFIGRVYFSEKCANSIKEDHHSSSIYIPTLEISDSSSFFEPLYRLWQIGTFSKDRKELFKYRFDAFNFDKKDINLPDNLETIHSYAFMFAEIGTLRIPASVKEIGKGAFFNAKIDNIIFEGKWTDNIDPEAFTGLEVSGSIRFNDTAQNITSFNELLAAVKNDCNKLTLAACDPCEEESPSIGYIRTTQAYYRNGYIFGWNNVKHNEGIIDLNTRYIVSVKEYEIPTYTPVLGTIITLVGSDRDQLHYDYIVYEPVEMVLAKIDKATKGLNATGCTVDELIDRINNRINR